MLILNEAITNAIKYAFTGKEKGKIESMLGYVADQHLTLKEEGVSFPDNFDISSQSSLGLNLIQGLTEQLEGTFNIENDQRLNISIITYPKEGMDALQRFNFFISGLPSY